MGAIFDLLCLACEQNNTIPKLKDAVQKSKVFEFRESLDSAWSRCAGVRKPGTTPADTPPAERLNAVFLPFNTVFFEFTDAGILMDNLATGERLCAELWMEEGKDAALAVTTFGLTAMKRSEVDPQPGEVACGGSGPVAYRAGNIYFAAVDSKRGRVVRSHLFKPTESAPPWFEDLMVTVIEFKITALLLAEEMAKPKQFIIEMMPTGKTRERQLKRTIDRPTYTSLHISEIGKRYGLTGREGTGTTPSPHPRRAHLRVLRSAFYKGARGTTVFVPECWIGPKESVIGNKKYRVVLDAFRHPSETDNGTTH